MVEYFQTELDKAHNTHGSAFCVQDCVGEHGAFVICRYSHLNAAAHPQCPEFDAGRCKTGELWFCVVCAEEQMREHK